MRFAALTIMLILSTAAVSATIYKWVDANGQTHYSDQPSPGATKVEVGATQTYSAPPPRPSSPAPQPQATQDYTLCEISRPANDQVFFNESSVAAIVRIDPGLRGNHRLTVAMDDKRLPQTIYPDSEFTISPVYRGSHTLIAVVTDQAGRTVCQSSPVTFHVRQPSVQAPNPSARPRF